MWCEEGKWSLPSDKGKGTINTFIIFYPKRKQSNGMISDNYKKWVERQS